MKVGGFAGLEVFGFQLVRSNFFGANDNAVFGDLTGVGEFVG